MNLDASTPEKMVAQISEWLYAKATNHMPGKAANLALRAAAQTIANAKLLAPEERVRNLEAAIREVDKKAEAGLCAGSLSGVRVFHCDIRLIARDLGLQGGLTAYLDCEEKL